MPRPIRLGAAALGLLAGSARWVEQRQLGFPDGHLTELERAMRLPHLVLACLCVGLAVVLAWPVGRSLWWILALGVALALDWVGPELLGRLLGLASGEGG